MFVCIRPLRMILRKAMSPKDLSWRSTFPPTGTVDDSENLAWRTRIMTTYIRQITDTICCARRVLLVLSKFSKARRLHPTIVLSSLPAASWSRLSWNPRQPRSVLPSSPLFYATSLSRRKATTASLTCRISSTTTSAESVPSPPWVLTIWTLSRVLSLTKHCPTRISSLFLSTKLRKWTATPWWNSTP